MREQKSKIEIGYRIGKLMVTSRTEKRKNRYTVWRCRCDCGRFIDLDTRYLQRGTVTDCGCVSKVKSGILDLTGKRFGKLVCLKLYNEKDKRGNIQWECRCDCGKTCIAAGAQLKSGYKKSCGCLSHPPLKSFIGKRFGKLTVTEYAGKRAGMHRWKCVCDCGNDTIVGQTLLQTGKTKSCGCYQKEQFIERMDFIDGTSPKMLKARMERPPIASNTSGYNGVYRGSNGVWIAQITFKKKTYYLGSFHDINDAVAARKKGEEMYEDFLEWYDHRSAEK